MNHDDILERLKKIKLLVLDLDGVLTDGRIIYDDFGDTFKFFDCTDGLGVVLLKKAGIPTAVISSKKSRANTRRCRELGVAKLIQNASDKHETFLNVLKIFKAKPSEVCTIGDDLVDLPMMRKSGVAAAVQNAVPEVKQAAHYVTTRYGGRGAVREVVEMILKAQGQWSAVTREYLL